jgi:phospholipase/carboxylesterase
MNRLAPRPSLSDIPAPDSNASISTRRFSDQASVDVSGGCHATFAPLHYEAGYAYPLVVWLHSSGGDEHELKRIMPLVSMRNYVGVSARGTLSLDAVSGTARGYDWSQADDHIFLAQQRVVSGIALARQRFNIDASRVFLAGYHAGGTMAFRLATAFPEQFAGVLSIGGEFPRGGSPLMRYKTARRLPMFLASCRDSAKYPEDRVCQDLRLFHSAGIKTTLRQYPCGDEMTTNMLSDMDHWIMELLSTTLANVIR